MNAPALLSTLSNIRRISSFLSLSGACATNSAFVMWQRCFWSVGGLSRMRRLGIVKPDLRRCLRAKRRGQAGKSWYVDETSIKVKGKWAYLYRAIDQEGNLVDSLRERKAKHGGCEAFFSASRRAW